MDGRIHSFEHHGFYIARRRSLRVVAGHTRQHAAIRRLHFHRPMEGQLLRQTAAYSSGLIPERCPAIRAVRRSLPPWPAPSAPSTPSAPSAPSAARHNIAPSAAQEPTPPVRSTRPHPDPSPPAHTTKPTKVHPPPLVTITSRKTTRLRIINFTICLQACDAFG